MSPRKATNVIDGFSSVQAVKRVAERKKPSASDGSREEFGVSAEKHAAVKPADSQETNSSSGKLSANASGVHVTAAHSVIPSKRLVICYVCGYSHTVMGKMHHSFCPKCKTKLNTDDVTVEGEFTEDILTIGNVKILSGAKIKDGVTILGQNVRIDADVSTAAGITATESLELCTNAKFKIGALNNIKGVICIPQDNFVEIDFAFTCATLKVYGTLFADMSVQECAYLYSGSSFKGTLLTPALIMEDGANMSATVNINKANKQ